jgi:small subunit ribosomal protein S8e
MGISRDSRHKRRLTGGRRNVHQKKRKYELGRPSANTRIGTKRVSVVRGRGGNEKYRALRLDTGNFSWGSESTTRKARILDVVYNASNNELVRTKTLVKNAIIQVDATAFRQWYEQHYNAQIGKKHKEDKEHAKTADGKEKEKSDKKSKKVIKTIAQRNKNHALDQNLKDQFNVGRLFASVTSRPGQSGRADGYILEGKELEFYLKKISKKK